MYTPDTVVAVRSFTRQQEGEDVIIGRPETGVFVAIPPEAVEVLDHLAEGKTVGEVVELYQRKYGEAPDLDDFLGLLETKGIVGSAPESEAPAVSSRQAQLKYHFSNFPHSLAQRIFSRPVLALGVVVGALAIVAVIRHPSLAAGPRDLYFPDHRTLSWTILIMASYATLFVHEFGHLVAARALGIKSRMGIGHRLWYLVAETDLTGLWSVPKQKRYLPLIAGTLVDAFSGALLVLLLFAQEERWFLLPMLATRLLRAMLFTYSARVVWQCFLFIRTDFYYVIANFFNCKNLLGDTEGFLRNQLARVIRRIRPVDQSAIPEAERKVIRVYAGFWIAGRIVALIVLVAITIPLAGRYVRNLNWALRTGYSANPADFIDALLLSSYFLIPFAVGLTLWISGMFRRERT
jgi:putative peptide zinc metalloprotease protein